MTVSNPPTSRGFDYVFGLPPETSDGLTFHLPLEIQARRVLGQTDNEILPSVSTALHQAYTAGLVDPPNYRNAVVYYLPVARAVLGNSKAERLKAWTRIVPLAEGLAGAAFHGVIRLAYGLLLENANEAARGMAYMRCRRKVLACDLESRAVVCDAREIGLELPVAGAIFDRLDYVAGDPGLSVDSLTGDPHLIAEEVLALFARTPSEFIAIHALTGLHALSEITECMRGVADSQIQIWWRSFELALRVIESILHDAIREDTADAMPLVSSDQAIRSALASANSHTIKSTVSLHRLERHGLINAHQAQRAVTLLLAASKEPQNVNQEGDK